MRLTKKESQVHDLIADGHDGKAIAALLKLEISELFTLLDSIKDKYAQEQSKTAKRKDIIMHNQIVAPRITGLTCQNLDKENPSYWFFTGFESDVLTAHEQFLGYGITTVIRKNGSKGKFWLLVPVWVTGELLPVYYQDVSKPLGSENLGKEGEKHVHNSITDSTTADCFETGFDYFGVIQSQDIECAT